MNILDEDEAVDLVNKNHAFIYSDPAKSGCSIVRIRDIPKQSGPLFVVDRRFPIFERTTNRKLNSEYRGLEVRKYTKFKVTTHTKSITSIWLSNHNQRRYDEIGFYPSLKPYNGSYNKVEDVDGTLNTFIGFGCDYDIVKRKDMHLLRDKCDLFLNHIRTMVCENNPKYYMYFIKWLAHMFQKPEETPGVAVVMYGKESRTKTIVADVISTLVGYHCLTITKMNQLITGRREPNQHLVDKLFVFCDEIDWSGIDVKWTGYDKKYIPQVLPLVVKVTIKYKDFWVYDKARTRLYSCRNLKRLLIACGDNNPIDNETTSNRYIVFRVSDKQDNNDKYFDAIIKQLEYNNNEGYYDLISYLMSGNIDHFHPRQGEFMTPQLDRPKIKRYPVYL